MADVVVAKSRNNSEPAAVMADIVVAKSRNNSVESADAQRAKETVKTHSEPVEVKKERAIPPPRKSSDPMNKTMSAPITSPPPKEVPVPLKVVPAPLAPSKDATPNLKHKVSNGTLPQSVQVPSPPVVQKQEAKATDTTKPSAKEEIQPQAKEQSPPKAESTESNGVGDKIRQFERAAEDATGGRTSRPGSVRGRVKSDMQERSNSQGSNPSIPENIEEKKQTATVDDSKIFSPTSLTKWRKEGSEATVSAFKSVTSKAEEKESKPSIKFNKFPQDLPVKFSSNFSDRKLPANIAPDVTSPLQTQKAARKEIEPSSDVVNTQSTFKTCKFKPKERHTPQKAPAYFTRGTEGIWLVKKKDIEAIEDRVMESFRRAGASSCRSEPIKEHSEVARHIPFAAGSNATLGRTKRGMYARSESLDPQYASRSQTLKRQSSVACTCGHDKKGRPKSGASAETPRPRSRSHGDDHSQAHVLDKYETLV